MYIALIHEKCFKHFTWGPRQAIPITLPFSTHWELYRGAVITNGASLYQTAFSRVLDLHMNGMRKCM